MEINFIRRSLFLLSYFPNGHIFHGLINTLRFNEQFKTHKKCKSPAGEEECFFGGNIFLWWWILAVPWLDSRVTMLKVLP